MNPSELFEDQEYEKEKKSHSKDAKPKDRFKWNEYPDAYKKGDKVICVDDDFDERLYDVIQNFPKINTVYTIRDVATTGGIPCYYLEEIKNKSLEVVDNVYFHTTFKMEPRFIYFRFKKIMYE
jgi:transposase